MSQPNILWICTDQQRYDTLGCYGNPYVTTSELRQMIGFPFQFAPVRDGNVRAKDRPLAGVSGVSDGLLRRTRVLERKDHGFGENVISLPEQNEDIALGLAFINLADSQARPLERRQRCFKGARIGVVTPGRNI